jgi:lipopolysaccharide transport system permease protein
MQQGLTKDKATTSAVDQGPPASHGQPPSRIIRPSTGWRALDLRSLWDFRGLIWFLGQRDIRLRYRQTLLGAAWAILQPAMQMVVFSIFFGRLAKMPSDGVSYPIFAFAGLLPWQLFSTCLNECSNSLITNKSIVAKVYFPRLVIPISSLATGIVDFVVGFILLAVLMLYFGVTPSARILLLPMLVALAVMTALGVGLWLAALNVKYRDVRYTLTFLIQLWMFATPVAYPSSLVPERWRPLLGINPMSGVVEGFRWALFGTGRVPDKMLLVSTVISIVALIFGLFYFRRVERTFADVI